MKVTPKSFPSGLFVLVIFVASAATLLAADRVIPRGASIYIEETDGDLDGYIRAEFVKRNVPLKIVLKAEEATLILTGTTTQEEKRKWHEGWLTAEKDRTTANVMVIDKATNSMLWASEAGDRSWLWGALRRGGHRKVAERLVKNLKKVIRE